MSGDFGVRACHWFELVSFVLLILVLPSNTMMSIPLIPKCQKWVKSEYRQGITY